MKIFSLFLLLAVVASTQCSPTHKDKRFIGWINDNIIKPIGDGVNDAIDAINDNVIKPIGGGVNDAIDWTGDNVIKPIGDFFEDVNDHVIQPAVGTVVDMTNFVINGPPTSSGQIQVQDYCDTTCIQRINFQGKTTDYSFDKANGCVSKGWQDNEVKMFDSCCDQHNTCLNAQCCTDKCQDLKNDCDASFYHCMKRECYITVDYNDNSKMNRCVSNAGFVANTAINKTCHPTATTNRKVCYC